MRNLQTKKLNLTNGNLDTSSSNDCPPESAYYLSTLVDPTCTVPLTIKDIMRYDVKRPATVEFTPVPDATQGIITDDFPPAITAPLESTVVSKAKTITSDDAAKTAYEITIRLHPDITYRVGEALGVSVPNTDQDVNYLIERLRIPDPDEVFRIDMNPAFDKKRKLKSDKAPPVANRPSWIPEHTSKRYILQNCIELRWPGMSKQFIAWCGEVATDLNEKRTLQELICKEGAENYRHHVLERRLTLIDLLHAFPSCTPTLQMILATFPRLKYRWYSACSSPNAENLVKFAFTNTFEPVSIVDSRFYAREGLATGTLRHLNEGDSVRIVQRTSTNFTLPEDTNTPVVMVATGTGVAPFIGFCEKRLQETGALTNMHLYYGCRHPDKDYLYRDQLERYSSDHGLKLNTVFSRHGPLVEQGVKYVQHLIPRTSPKISDLLQNENATLFICGDRSAMAKDFRQSLISDVGLDTVKKWTVEGKIREDLWS